MQITMKVLAGQLLRIAAQAEAQEALSTEFRSGWFEPHDLDAQTAAVLQPMGQQSGAVVVGDLHRVEARPFLDAGAVRLGLAGVDLAENQDGVVYRQAARMWQAQAEHGVLRVSDAIQPAIAGQAGMQECRGHPECLQHAHALRIRVPDRRKQAELLQGSRTAEPVVEARQIEPDARRIRGVGR